MKSKNQVAYAREAAKRVKKVRRLLGESIGKRMTQEHFARRLGVKGPNVAGWERGVRGFAPGGKMLAKLIRAAMDAGAIEDARWFADRLGLDLDVIVSAAVPVIFGETLRIAETEHIPGGGWGLVGRRERQGPGGIVLSARFADGIQIPQGFVLDKDFIGSGFASARDRLLLDWSAGTGFGQDLTPFWEQLVLVEFAPLESAGRIPSYSHRFGVLRREATQGGLSQAVLVEPFGGKLVVGMSDADGKLAPLPGVRILGRAFGWLRAPQERQQATRRPKQKQREGKR